MNTLHLARLAIFVVLGINLSNSSPLERLKRALETQGDNCPPGIWTCLIDTQQKRNKMLNQPQESIDQPAQLSSEQSGGSCPPGIWTCVNNEPAEEQKRLANSQSDASAPAAAPRESAAEEKRSHPITSDNDEDNDENDELNSGPPKCPPGIWVCRRKRALKRMMEKAKRRVQRSTQKCPPGIWVC